MARKRKLRGTKIGKKSKKLRGKALGQMRLRKLWASKKKYDDPNELAVAAASVYAAMMLASGDTIDAHEDAHDEALAWADAHASSSSVAEDADYDQYF